MARALLTRIALALVLSTQVTVLGAAPGQPQELQLKADTQAVSVFEGGQRLMLYRFGEVPFKPYVKEFCSPEGINVLRDAPHDHLHHHALMFAIAADGVNFWEEAASSGREIHRAVTKTRSSATNGRAMASFTERLDWVNAGNDPILTEERTLVVHRSANLGASLLTWRTNLRPAEGHNSVRLGGSHYYGLGMRFLESMDKGGEFTYADGKAPGEIMRGDERLTRANWCAYSAKADGNNVTVAMFDHPGNQRHPALWFTMADPFSYLSATLNLWKEPMTLRKGDRLDLRYGVAVWDGQVDPKKIEQLYQYWVELTTAQKEE